MSSRNLKIFICLFISQILGSVITDFAHCSTVAFYFLGDSGDEQSANYASTVDSIRNFGDDLSCAFTILGGDNYYEVGVKSVHDSRLSSLHGLPTGLVCLAVGNHDFYSTFKGQTGGGCVSCLLDYAKNSRNNAGSRVIFPAMNYALTFELAGGKSMHVIFLTTYDTSFDKSRTFRESFRIDETVRWLSDHLRVNSHVVSKSDYVFVVGHYPFFSRGSDYLLRDTQLTGIMIDKILPMLMKIENLYLYISGHDHATEHLVYSREKSLNLIVSGNAARAYKLTRPVDSIGSRLTSLGFKFDKVKERVSAEYGKVGQTSPIGYARIVVDTRVDTVVSSLIDSQSKSVLFSKRILSIDSSSPSTSDAQFAKTTDPQSSGTLNRTHPAKTGPYLYSSTGPYHHSTAGPSRPSFVKSTGAVAFVIFLVFLYDM